ncbi:MAG TPA: hypothetical protein VGC50_09405 [Gammaproteobacteria bacterium]|jgi:hypothetical protein
MKLTRWIVAGVLFAAAAFVSVGQEPGSENPPARDDSTEAPADDARTLEEIFIPSEEIAADEEVTFPIDI